VARGSEREYNGPAMRRRPPALERYGYLVAAACVAAATAAFYPGREHFAKGQWALLYLLIVVLVASLSGIRPALAAAVLSFFAWNYFFIPPFHTFRVADPKDWLFLFVFLAVGIVMGLQTGRMRAREAQAVEREGEAVLLSRFSAHLVSDISVEEMATRLIGEVGGVAGAARLALFVWGEEEASPQCLASKKGDCASPEIVSLATWVHRQSKAIGLPPPPSSLRAQGLAWPASVSHQEAGGDGGRKDLFVPLQTATRQLGVLYVGERADGAAYTHDEARLIVALTYQASMYLERTYLRSLAVQADALREADRLKSTFISAVSHELKTPLASLEATLTNLLEQDAPTEQSQIRRELQAVQQDLDRLSASIDSLLDLSRLEAAAWGPRLDWYELGEMLGTALTRLAPDDRARVSFSIPSDLPPLHVDFDQWVRVLEHLLRNALTYSGTAAPVRVEASFSPGEIRFWVEDEGPGIALDERARIFEKFYRGRMASQVPSGTGLGLAITREIIRFHGGRIWVEDVLPHGARFVVSVPTTGASREQTA